MKHEIASLLCNCLERQFSWASMSFQDCWNVIELPPKQVEADYSIAVSFKLASLARSANLVKELWEPNAIGKHLLSSFSDSKYFDVSLSAKGHLNFIAKAHWYSEFINHCIRGGLMIESDESCLVVPNILSSPETLSSLINDNETFLLECGFSQFQAQTADPPREMLLMLLGVLANEELDSRSYRLGLHSLENVPLSIDTYLAQYRSFSKGIDFKDFELKVETSIKPHSAYQLWQESFFLGAILFWLSRTREALYCDKSLINKAYFSTAFSHLLSGIKLFSNFYNHPRNRESASVQARVLAGIQGREIENTLRIMIGGKSL